MTALEKDQLMCPRRGDEEQETTSHTGLKIVYQLQGSNTNVFFPICFSSVEGRYSF